MGGIPRPNSAALMRERGAQPEASTASEGSGPNHVEEQQNPTTNIAVATPTPLRQGHVYGRDGKPHDEQLVRPITVCALESVAIRPHPLRP